MGVIEELSGKKILIWGYGREGKSTERFLKRCCKDNQIDIFEGSKDDINEEQYDYIFKSPGIKALDCSKKYISQTYVFFKEYRNNVIGITGTKGKSTTSSLLLSCLQMSGKKAVLLGNIGIPCLDYFDKVDKDTIVVFELSCHQLVNMPISPHISVFLNLYEEHLDYYDTMDNYFSAKSNIIIHQNPGDYAFIGENVPALVSESRQEILHDKDVPEYDLIIQGRHNQINALFVFKICELFQCDPEKVHQAMREFHGLSHRLQYVGENDGIEYYDDSIATIPEAAIRAVQCIHNVETVLIGGLDRGIEYDALIDFIRLHSNIKFICMYDTGAKIYKLAASDNCTLVNDLQEAVSLAKQLTHAGNACLLSPAAASYGYFKNFEERGEQFQKYALNQ